MSGLTAGTIYYLKGGSGVPANWDIAANVSTLVPLYQAVATDTVFILSHGVAGSGGGFFVGASSGADGAGGIVPKPLAGQQNYVLTGGGVWAVNTPANGSVSWDQLMVPPSPYPGGYLSGLWTSPAGKSPRDHLTDLLTRCQQLAFRQVSDANTIVSDSSPGTSKTFTVPAGVKFMLVELWGAGGAARNSVLYPDVSGGGGGAYCRFIIPVTAGDVYTYQVGQGGGTGNLKDTWWKAPSSIILATAQGGMNAGETHTYGNSANATILDAQAILDNSVNTASNFVLMLVGQAVWPWPTNFGGAGGPPAQMLKTPIGFPTQWGGKGANGGRGGRDGAGNDALGTPWINGAFPGGGACGGENGIGSGANGWVRLLY
jgi:hypothetical protein